MRRRLADEANNELPRDRPYRDGLSRASSILRVADGARGTSGRMPAMSRVRGVDQAGAGAIALSLRRFLTSYALTCMQPAHHQTERATKPVSAETSGRKLRECTSLSTVCILRSDLGHPRASVV